MGGSLTAVAPDFTRAALGVPGMNYSVLLQRSVDFDTYAQVMYNAYPDQLQRPLLLSLIQLLWDRAEADGYAAHMTTDPYPDTPAHQVILSMAYGDHQVSNWTTIVEARTIGARVRTPVVAPFRNQGDSFYGIDDDRRLPRAAPRAAVGLRRRPAAQQRQQGHATAADLQRAQPAGRRPARPRRVRAGLGARADRRVPAARRRLDADRGLRRPPVLARRLGRPLDVVP